MDLPYQQLGSCEREQLHRWIVRAVRGAARRLRAGNWELRAQWLRYRGVETAARALLRARPELAIRILRASGASIGDGTTIRPPVHILNPRAGFSQLSIGRDVWIGPDVLLDLAAPIDIGDRATLSARASVVTHIDVGASCVSQSHPPAAGPVTIADDAYLGTAATVLHGCSVGEAALVAAASLVRRSVPARTVVAGIPARPVREISQR